MIQNKSPALLWARWNVKQYKKGLILKISRELYNGLGSKGKLLDLM